MFSPVNLVHPQMSPVWVSSFSSDDRGSMAAHVRARLQQFEDPVDRPGPIGECLLQVLSSGGLCSPHVVQGSGHIVISAKRCAGNRSGTAYEFYSAPRA